MSQQPTLTAKQLLALNAVLLVYCNLVVKLLSKNSWTTRM